MPTNYHPGRKISREKWLHWEASQADMADKDEKLVKLFGSTSRARILDFLCSHSAESYYQWEIMHETGLSLQAVQRELGILAELGIIKKRDAHARVYYHLNPSSPLLHPLIEICGCFRAD
jgi:predicted transcriptional regulator